MSRHTNASIIKYHGGKAKIADWICAKMPPHACYVEPFGGGASVLLRKSPVTTEVYNDLDLEVYNAFKTIRENTEALYNALSMSLFSREELREAFEPTPDRVEAARRFIVRSHLAINTAVQAGYQGFRSNINKDDYWSNAPTFYRIPELLLRVRSRLSSVIIENCDAFSLFDRYDLPKTLWYLDPPYVNNTRSAKSIKCGYEHNMTDAEHVALCDRIKRLKGYVMLSGYDNEIYNSNLDGWHREYRKGFTDSKRGAIEVLWMNFHYKTLFD